MSILDRLAAREDIAKALREVLPGTFMEAGEPTWTDFSYEATDIALGIIELKFEQWKLSQLRLDKFECKDCSGIPECPMIVDEVWTKIGPKRDFLLCMECAEKRLGRLFTFEDLSNVPFNRTTRVMLQRAKADADNTVMFIDEIERDRL